MTIFDNVYQAHNRDVRAAGYAEGYWEGYMDGLEAMRRYIMGEATTENPWEYARRESKELEYGQA